MRKIFLYTLSILSISIASQELSEAYLASLPESVRESVLEGISEKKESDKPDYRRPSTMIYKTDRCNDINFDNYDSKDLELLDSEDLIKLMKEEEEEDCSERFGDEIFTMMQSSFMPINEPNFDSTYTLDFGDSLEIQIIGQKNIVEEFPIKRDGSITVPDIGKIYVSGLSLDAATKMIASKVENALIGVEVYVSLISVRDIQVLVTGNAYQPGIYTLNGNSNILHALSMAGGIDSIGSYREIELIRDNEVVDVLDLYDIFIKGKYAFGKRLRTGDSILVKPAKSLVKISGAVNRENTYEAIEGETFADLINFSNGFSNLADKSYIRIQRLQKDEVKYITLEEDDLSSEMPKNGDSLYVKGYSYRTITIKGAVQNPGEYIIAEDETVGSIITKAQGYKSNAYPFGGVLTNKKTKKINEAASEKLYKTFIQSLITKGNTLFASDMLPLVLEELQDTKSSGRVIAEFDLDVIAASPQLDTTLEDGDQILIPFKTENIYIYGEINNPGTTRYVPNQTASMYIESIGGVLESGDPQNIFIVHPNGEVNSIKYGIFNKKNNDVAIYPGSVIYIPKIIKGEGMATASIWAPIISGLAVSITSLSVLGNN